MNKIKLLSAAILILAMAGAAKAQFAYIKTDDIDEFHARTLIVIVEKPADDVTEKLNKKHKADKVADYKKAIDAFNKNFADAIVKYWKVSGGEVEYKTLDDVNDITDKKNYAVLFFRSVAQSDLTTSYQAKNGITWWPDFKEVTHDKDFSGKITVMGMALLDKFNKNPFYQFPIPDLYPTKADVEYALNAANKYIDYRINHRKSSAKKIDDEMIQENQPILKEKTLLLRRDLLDKKLTKAEIEKDYPFPYLVTGKDTVDKAIDSADSRYAVAIVAPSDFEVGTNGGLSYVQYAYNVEDGAFLASSGIPDMPSAPTTNTSVTNNSKPLITKKTLLDFCMYIKTEDESDGGKKKKGKR